MAAIHRASLDSRMTLFRGSLIAIQGLSQEGNILIEEVPFPFPFLIIPLKQVILGNFSNV